MDTPFPNVDPEGLLYQYETESDEIDTDETDDVATWLEEEFTEYPDGDLDYPDEIRQDELDAIERAPSEAAAAKVVKSILESNDDEFELTLRVTRRQFHRLMDWLLDNTSFGDKTLKNCHQKLMVFLYIMGYAKTQQRVAYRFRISRQSVSRIFSEVLNYMADLHVAFVQMPGDTYVSDKISNQEKYSGLNGCLGSIDAVHLPVHVPWTDKRLYQSQNGEICQKVLAAVSFGGRFLHVLAGAEGSLKNATFMQIASRMDFKVPKGRFFLGNTGLGNTRRGILCPYPKVSYDLVKYAESGVPPQTPEQLFNLRHSSARVIVEKVFNMMKRRWDILEVSPPEYSVRDQTRIIYAVTGLHNFLLMKGVQPEVYTEQKEEALSASEKLARQHSLELADEVVGDRIGKHVRDDIAQALWANYRRFVDGS